MIDAVKGELKDDKEEEDQYHKDAKIAHKVSKKLDEFSIVSTALVIMIAGYDTTASTLGFTAYELAKNPGVQDKLREEIDSLVEDDEENIKYEDLQKMTYMDQVLSEVLRFHTPLPFIQRNSNEEYRLQTGNDKVVLIPKATEIWINIKALHFNPKYYSNPHSFDPEHFSKEAKATRHP